MSKVILKDRLIYNESGNILLHIGVDCKVLCAQMQDGFITVWYESERAPTQTGDREFYVLPTGLADIPEDGWYLGTVQNGGAVWHVYEKMPAA